MPYIGQIPSTGENNNFKILDNILSYTETFNGSSSGVVSVADDTLTFVSHRFITGQRITYSTTGTAIGGLVTSTAYFVIKNDQNTIKLASTFANANNNVAINLTALGTGTTHTINVAFDGVNTKFKATYDNGTKALITRAGQLQISINGVIQQPQDTTSPTNGFGIDLDGVIIFSTAPANTDIFWGNVFANNFATFDISDNTVDSFTGNGSLVDFTLSKIPANNQNILVTIDGVVQYPSDNTTIRAYGLSENILTFVGAPGNATAIQVRHIGFAGATSSSVTGFYGRTGNVGLTTADIVSIGAATIGTGGIGTSLLVQGNARITGILTVGTGSITIDGVNNTITGAININATGISTVGSLSIGNTSVISSGRQLQNIASLDATTTATIESAVANAPNTFTDLSVSGISTLGITTATNLTAQSLVVSGISTLGVTSATNLTSQSLRITGISTFTNGPVLVGSGTSTGTASQPLQVTGGAYVSGNLGIGTTNPTVALDVAGNARVSGIITASGGIVVGATTSITVGSAFIKNNAVGLGVTTTIGRNAGVSTATGTIIFNSNNAKVQVYNGTEWANIGDEQYIEATGGTISDYTSGSDIYRAHIFTSSGSLSVTKAPASQSTVEYLVVAGGGGATSYYSGGGGAGGFRTGTGFPVSTSPGAYTITVGAGGAGNATATLPSAGIGANGIDSVFAPGYVGVVTSTGGGGGASRQTGGAGGSGGGGGNASTSGGAGNTPPSSPPQGNSGGNGNGTGGASDIAAGGGGGATAAGTSGVYNTTRGVGGAGTPSSITGITTHYAGGGGGGASGSLGSVRTSGGSGGGGGGGGGPGYNPIFSGTNGDTSTGSGGGGGGEVPGTGGSGGSGIVVVRYLIGELAATAKATGGLISYASGKTIHQFLSSGTFTVTNPGLSDVDYLVVAGGGGGGSRFGGGGGAGGFRTGSGFPVSPGPYSITVGGAGAGGAATGGAGTNGASVGGNGTSSIFSTVTSQGGGGGAYGDSGPGTPGGSGGGGAGRFDTAPGLGNRETGTPTPAPSQGNDGANPTGSPYIGGGGGGAGGGGNTAGTGGGGSPSSISGTPTTYAGGGGGGGSSDPANPAAIGGAGGSGGGGAGGPTTGSSTNGTTNLGGGGGGGAFGTPSSPGNFAGAAGGSGIVIIAYPS